MTELKYVPKKTEPNPWKEVQKEWEKAGKEFITLDIKTPLKLGSRGVIKDQNGVFIPVKSMSLKFSGMETTKLYLVIHCLHSLDLKYYSESSLRFQVYALDTITTIIDRFGRTFKGIEEVKLLAKDGPIQEVGVTLNLSGFKFELLPDKES